jgi:hypothetical protein
LRASLALDALRTLLTLYPLWPLRPGLTLDALRSRLALRPLRTDRSLRSDGDVHRVLSDGPTATPGNQHITARNNIRRYLSHEAGIALLQDSERSTAKRHLNRTAVVEILAGDDQLLRRRKLINDRVYDF